MKKNILLAIGVLLICVVVFFLFFVNRAEGPTPNATSTGATTTTIRTEDGIEFTGTGGFTVEQEVVPAYKMPNLAGTLLITEKLSDEVKQTLQKSYQNVVVGLQKDPKQYELWLQLGNLKKMAGDYKGAQEAWLYATTMSHNYVVYANLGDINAYFLKDYKSAEAYFLKAISMAKDHADLYVNTYDFYKNVIKDPVKARKILEQGIAANPTSNTEQLKYLLSQ